MLSLGYIKKTKNKTGIMAFYAAISQHILYVADDHIVTSWQFLPNNVFRLMRTASWNELDPKFKQMRIFQRDIDNDLDKYITDYHYYVGGLIRLAYTYRAYSLGRKRNWKEIKVIEDLLLRHQYDQVRDRLKDEFGRLFGYKAVKPFEETGKFDIELWAAGLVQA